MNNTTDLSTHTEEKLTLSPSDYVNGKLVEPKRPDLSVFPSTANTTGRKLNGPVQ